MTSKGNNMCYCRSYEMDSMQRVARILNSLQNQGTYQFSWLQTVLVPFWKPTIQTHQLKRSSKTICGITSRNYPKTSMCPILSVYLFFLW